MHFQRASRVLLVVTLLVGPSWVAPAAAETFTVRWDYGLAGGPDVPAPSPFYECSHVGGGGLICEWLWEKGLEIGAALPGFPMYGDGGPFFDAYGVQLPLESDLQAGTGLLRIVPKCLAGIHPCFDTFTPLRMVADGFFDSTRLPGGVFFSSSGGGLITSLNGVASFAGPEWANIAWMDVGLFLPDPCGDPELGLDCGQGEQALSIFSLTFEAEPVPEPASVVLLGTGLAALVHRYRRRV